MTERVQIPAYTDRWMKGDRYGEVLGYARQTSKHIGQPDVYRVKLDISGKTIRVIADDCTPI